jgi:hypothetical protein
MILRGAQIIQTTRFWRKICPGSHPGKANIISANFMTKTKHFMYFCPENVE